MRKFFVRLALVGLGAGAAGGATVGAGGDAAGWDAAEREVADPHPPGTALGWAPAAVDTLVLGRVVERVVSTADPSASYAAYLPSTYDPSRRWPLLLVLDPRGRALQATERFRPEAERLGWMVLSSYDSRSDVAEDPNTAAVLAMAEDADRWLSLDPRRIYLAGFSGTARIGWHLAQRLEDHVAGLLGFGAGLPGLYVLPRLSEDDRPTRLSFFGGAGRADFNFDEVRRLDAMLDHLPVEHRIVHYPGPHAWPPAEVAGAGLRWLELQAIRTGLRPPDASLVGGFYRRDLREARRLREEGWLVEARALTISAARDYGELLDTSEASALASELASAPGYREAVERAGRLAEEADAYRSRLDELLEAYDSSTPPTAEEASARLEIERLRQAARDEDALGRAAAARLLATVFSQTSFYRPRRYLAAGEPGKAVAVLRIARAVRPGSGRVCLQLARAHAAAGETDAAARELRCALEQGVVSPARVESDPWLREISGTPAVRRLLERHESG